MIYKPYVSELKIFNCVDLIVTNKPLVIMDVINMGIYNSLFTLII